MATARQQLSLALITFAALLAMLSGCVYDSATIESLRCAPEGARDGERVCQGGVWVQDGTLVPDEPIDLPDCVPETDEALCAARIGQCGELEVQDRCDQTRQISCLQCPAGERCDASARTCVCVPEDDIAFCDRLRADVDSLCGTVTAQDNCGASRTVPCGGCDDAAGELCDDDTNRCVCTPEDDQALCDRYGADCGMITRADRCGAQRTVSCGGCDGGEQCNAQTNLCPTCRPRTPAQLCAQAGAQCGTIDAMNCGQPQTVDCGAAIGCVNDRTCQGTQCVCPEPVCPPNVCGTIANACNETKDCGGCQGDASCNNNSCVCSPPVCLATQQCGSISNSCGTTMCGDQGMCPGGFTCTGNTCDCPSESPLAFCTRLNKRCGLVTALDTCNITRTYDCSAALGACGAGEQCGSDNQCFCPPAECGSAQCGTITNACGNMIMGCGPMNGSCGPAESCNNNQCQCDTPVCPANAECGIVTNACGGSTSCGAMGGACPSGEACVANQCEPTCTPSDAATLCAANNLACGTHMLADNGCGASTSVTCGNSGACVNSAQVCSATIGLCMTPLSPPTAQASQRFGASLSVTASSSASADYLAVGSPGYNDGGTNNAGAVYIFQRASASSTWTPFATITSPYKRANGRFGASVSISRVGTSVDLLIGAPGERNSLTGRAYLYRISAANNTISQLGRIEEDSLVGGAQFGESVSMDNDWLVIGAPGEQVTSTNPTTPRAGRAFVYRCNNAKTSCRTEEAILQAASPGHDDRFGSSVSLYRHSGNNVRLIIGSANDESGGNNRGSAAIYRRTGASAFGRTYALAPANMTDNQRMGTSAAISSDRFLLGAPNTTGSGRVYTGSYQEAPSNPPVTLTLGTNTNTQALFTDGGGFTQLPNDLAGQSVALSGDVALIGAPGAASGRGASYLLHYIASQWTPVLTLIPPTAEAALSYGEAVTLNANYRFVGASGSNKVYITIP